MCNDEEIIKILDSLIQKIEAIIKDKSKQSFGSLEHFLPQVIATKNEKLYLKNNWFFNLPRWLGEFGNTPEEDDIYSDLVKIQLYVAEKYHGGWGMNKK